MKCTECGKEKTIPQLQFIPNGKVAGVINVMRYDAVCHDCRRKVPIDHRVTKTEVTDGAAPF